MFTVEVTFDRELLDRIQAAAAVLPVTVDKLVKREVSAFVRHEVDKRLRVEPGPVQYKIQWTPAAAQDHPPNVFYLGKHYYSLQKAAFFATNGFGHGIPYSRTHQLVRRWHVIGDYQGGLGAIRVFNDDPVTQFVFGRRRQQFHANTGWPAAASELQRISIEAGERLEDVLSRVSMDAALGKVSA